MERRVQAGLSTSEGRRFGLVVGTAFLAVTALVWWRGHGGAAWLTGTLGCFLILGGVAVPGRMGPAHRGWMALAHAISRVTTPIVMGISYFLVLAPVGLAMRALGRNPLKARGTGSGFWVERDHSSPPDPSTMKRKF